MPYTLKQFKKDLVLDHLDELEPDQVLSKYKPEERLRGLKAEERLRGLKAEQVLSKYKPEERLRGMSRRQLEAYLRKLKKGKARGKNGR